MKKTLLTIATSLFLITACQQATTENSGEEIQAHEHNGVGDPMEEDNTEVHTAKEAYVCPMTCEGEKVYAEPGKCPICSMDLEKVN